MTQPILERYAWTLIRNLVVEHNFTCYAPGALFAEASLFRGENNRGLLIRPIPAEGKTATEIGAMIEEGFMRTDEITRASELKSATIVHLLLFETKPSVGMLNAIRSLERHQTYPDISLYTAVFSVGDQFYHLYVPLYAKGLLPASTIRRTAENIPEEVNFSQLQSQMNQAGERRRKEWGKLFVQTSSKGTYLFLLFCVLIYIWTVALQTDSLDWQTLLIKFGAKLNPLLADGQYWRLLTPIFLHLSFMHLVVNMAALYSLRIVEWMFGSYRFLMVFLLSGIGGNAASFALSPAPSAGASGAIFGLIGALLYFGTEHRALFRRAFSSSIWITLAINAVLGFTLSFVDNWAHLGGLVAGFLTAVLVGLPGDEKISFKKLLAAILIAAFLLGSVSYGTWKTRSAEAYHIFHADILHQSMEYRQELKELLLALQMNPADVNVLIRIGNLEQVLKDPDKAAYYLEKAVQIAHQSPMAHCQLGIFYENQQKDVQAAEEYHKALEIDPSFAEAKDRLAGLKTR